jgi:hypothetical protein
MKEYIKLICIAIGGSVAVKINALLISKGLNAEHAIILSGIVAVFVYKIIEYIFAELPIRFKWTRKIIDPKSKFEDQWIFQLQNLDGRPYSLISIDYIPEDKSYLISGCGVDPNGNIRSKWNGTDITFHLKANELRYSYESRLVDKNADITSGYGVMKFDQDRKGKLSRGVGFFVDTGSTFFKCNYLIEKVTKDLILKCLGKKDVYTNVDVGNLIRKYHCDYPKQNLTTSSSGRKKLRR